MQTIQAVRDFFTRAGFDETDTPALQVCPGLEPHLKVFETELADPGGAENRKRYLHTSPEYAMKKLLTAGMKKIYYLGHVFRNEEAGSLHSPEFTMLEWYRARADYTAIMEDSVNLLRHVACALNIDAYRYKGKSADPFAEWERITVRDAFRHYAGTDLEDALARLPENEKGRAEWDSWFFDVLMDKIEPHIGAERPAILYEYPAHMAALSRIKSDDPRWAERFEIYVCGLELANAFTELTDAAEQEKRFREDQEMRHQLYGETLPMDEEFLAALRYGMPEAGGIALGIDRLAMLVTGGDDIGDVLWSGRDL